MSDLPPLPEDSAQDPAPRQEPPPRSYRLTRRTFLKLGATTAAVGGAAYRSPQYNAKCPGASTRSQHLYNRALDLVYDCPSEDAFAMAKTLREEGFFTGGLGFHDTFIHLDPRSPNATWGV